MKTVKQNFVWFYVEIQICFLFIFSNLLQMFWVIPLFANFLSSTLVYYLPSTWKLDFHIPADFVNTYSLFVPPTNLVATCSFVSLVCWACIMYAITCVQPCVSLQNSYSQCSHTLTCIAILWRLCIKQMSLRMNWIV